MNIKDIDFENKLIFTSETKIQYNTLIIASGMTVNKLNIETEKQYLFKGLSYCAICDGSLYKNKEIVVVTNGFTGKSAVDYLSNLTEKITIIDYSNKYMSDKFKVYNNSKIRKINGQNKVENVDIEINGLECVNVPCNAVFVSLGKSTNLELYHGINIKNGYILTDENMYTNKDGVFAAGDIRFKNLRQIVTACADGAIAATEAIKYINNK